MNKSIVEKENLKSFYKTTNTFRVQVKDNCTMLFKQRDNLRKDLIKVQDIEGTISDIMNSVNIDFTNSLSIYKDAKNSDVNPKLIEKFFLFLSSKKEEFFRNEIKKLTAKDKKIISSYFDDIKDNKWIISKEVILKLEELLAEEPASQIKKK
jgi:hypothetical protein